MRKRLFIGVPVPKDFVLKLHEFKKNIRNLPDARWVNDENIHLTVCFLGNVNESLVPKLIETIISCLQFQNAITLEFDKYRLAPWRSGPGTIWARFEDSEEWYSFTKKIFESCRPYMEKNPDQKKQIPHITLARIKKFVPGILINFPEREMSGKKFLVNRCNLYESELAPGGSKYTVMKNFNFPHS